MSYTRVRFLSYGKKLALLNAIFEMLGGAGARSARRSGSSCLSLEKDSAPLYAAFLQAYGIDLQRDNLDWRAFCALLCNIPECTALHKIIRARMNENQTTQSIGDGLEALFEKLGGTKNV
jgi:hypothetical protein